MFQDISACDYDMKRPAKSVSDIYLYFLILHFSISIDAGKMIARHFATFFICNKNDNFCCDSVTAQKSIETKKLKGL